MRHKTYITWTRWHFYNCLLDKTLSFKGQSCPREKSAQEMIQCVSNDGSDMHALIVVAKPLKPLVLKT
jgi:hypothetical protein